MRKVYYKVSKILFNVIFAVAVASVNVTCGRKYYQEKLDGRLEALRKYKDE